MPASSPDPVRVLLAGFGVVFALGLALIAWAGRDTNPPILVEPVVEQPSDDIVRIDADADDRAGTDVATPAADLVAGADPRAGGAAARTTVGALHTWRDAFQPYDVRTDRTFETFRVLWFAADGERRVHAPDEALAADALAPGALIAVVVEGFAPRVTTGAAVAQASEVDRRLQLHPTSTVRIELEPGAPWAPELAHAVVASRHARPLEGLREPTPRAERLEDFADHLRELLDESTDAMRCSTLLANLRESAFFAPVTSLTPGRRPEWGEAPFLAPFGIARRQGELELPALFEDVVVAGPLGIRVVANGPVDLVRDVGSDAVAELGRHVQRGFHCDDGDDVTVYVRAGAVGGYFGRLPYGATDAQFDAKYRARPKHWWQSVRPPVLRDGSVVDGSPIELAADGSFEWLSTRPGMHRLVARWSEPGGVVAFCDLEFDVAAGEFVDLGVLAPTPSTVVRTHMRFVDREGVELEDLTARLYGFELDGRIDGANSVLEVFADDQPLVDVVTFTADRTTVELRGLPTEELGLRPLVLRLPPTVGEDWAVATSFAATPFTPVVGAVVDVDVPIEVEAQIHVRLQVPLEGDLFAPGIHYTGAALRRATGDDRYFAFTWNDAGYSEVEFDLPAGEWEILVAAATSRAHPVHPSEVWYASTMLRLEPGPPVERILRVAPGATVVATAAALGARGADLGMDEEVASTMHHEVTPVDFPGFSALVRRVRANEDGEFVIEHLAPGTEYEVRTNGRRFWSGRSGSILRFDG
ncbi:hypothetical protein Pla163_03320 [Planctomycetes bacterium Pla163]|uniref:Uncharacterized protein n=1 Tax=Rohdeia mirabilis TaxID=2528008 RepID=A0A518CVJ3_9BACT|nr:hypothetical protein Pla163_03320 [Planctomycetes bacterium Pla163]